jgi:hypothetical protein
MRHSINERATAWRSGTPRAALAAEDPSSPLEEALDALLEAVQNEPAERTFASVAEFLDQVVEDLCAEIEVTANTDQSPLSFSSGSLSPAGLSPAWSSFGAVPQSSPVASLVSLWQAPILVRCAALGAGGAVEARVTAPAREGTVVTI